VYKQLGDEISLYGGIAGALSGFVLLLISLGIVFGLTKDNTQNYLCRCFQDTEDDNTDGYRLLHVCFGCPVMSLLSSLLVGLVSCQ